MAEEPKLTDRQREVLRLAQEGKSPTEIGKELGISSQGVHGHMRRLAAHGLIEREPRRRADNGRPIRPADSLETVRRTAKAEIATLKRRLEALDRDMAKLGEEREEIEAAIADLQKMADGES